LFALLPTVSASSLFCASIWLLIDAAATRILAVLLLHLATPSALRPLLLPAAGLYCAHNRTAWRSGMVLLPVCWRQR
jgi:hypothetical protein